MEVTVQIPDDLASRMQTGTAVDLPRRALEALAVEEFKSGRFSKLEIRRPLGLETKYELDGFLKAHGVFDVYSLEDFEQEREALRSLQR